MHHGASGVTRSTLDSRLSTFSVIFDLFCGSNHVHTGAFHFIKERQAEEDDD
jgi:hypothetical protein